MTSKILSQGWSKYLCKFPKSFPPRSNQKLKKKKFGMETKTQISLTSCFCTNNYRYSNMYRLNCKTLSVLMAANVAVLELFDFGPSMQCVSISHCYWTTINGHQRLSLHKHRTLIAENCWIVFPSRSIDFCPLNMHIHLLL